MANHVSASQAEKDAYWMSSIKYVERKDELSINMSGWALKDEDMQEWCVWFGRYSWRLPGRPSELLAKDVNIAENQLTGRGLQHFFTTLSACGVSIAVCKLHHNRLEDGAGIADFVRNCGGSLRELHLSHNELSTSAAAEIILAAAAAKDESGSHCYPRQVGGTHGASPLWLRLEQNFVSPSELSELVEPAYREFGRKGTQAICTVMSKACTPHSCAKHRHHPPVIHAKHLSNQRARPSSNSAQHTNAAKLAPPPAPAAQDILSLLGVPTTAGTEDTSPPTCTVANVLRWDEGLSRWVKDTIEIPEVIEDHIEGGRVKISQKLGHQMGNELKNLFMRKPACGEGFLRQPAAPYDHSSSSAPLPEPGPPLRHGKPATTILHRMPGALEADGSPHRSMAGSTRSSRRGSQPLSSDVKQANGTALNPQAIEFYPTGSSVVKAPLFNAEAHRPSGLTILNPKAVQFRPTGLVPPPPDQLPQSMRGISESLIHMNRPSRDHKKKSSDPAVVKANMAGATAWLEAASLNGVYKSKDLDDTEIPKPPSPPLEPEPEAEADAEQDSRDVPEKWLTMAESTTEAAQPAGSESSMGKVFRRALTVTSAVIAFSAGTAAVARSRKGRP